MDLKGVFAVGDALRDVQAAMAVGAKPVLVRTGKGMKTLQAGQLPEDVPVYDNLLQAAMAIIETPAA
jgi:D-glycero-D-manno-heptose 1,7-bisphosphate phosphatase